MWEHTVQNHSWQWMRAESIHHMEANKENNVAEWHVCSLWRPPAAASLPASARPAVSSSHMPSPPTHSAPQSLSSLRCIRTQSETTLKSQAEPPTRRLHIAHVDQTQRALGFLCYWRVPDYTQAKQVQPPLTPPLHHYLFKKLPRSLATPLAFRKALPSCYVLNMKAPFEGKKASGTCFRG